MIDWARVEELQAEIGEEDFAEIAALFLSELTEVIESLREARDPAVLRDGYHSLKGSALNLGFSTLATYCAAAETDPGAADLAEIQAACMEGTAELLSRFPGIAA